MATENGAEHLEGGKDCWYYKVKMTHELVERMAFRTLDGYRIWFEWGLPDDEGFYQPLVRIDFNDRLGA